MRTRIIPVIDLKGGQVVRGIAGDRGRYAPVVSRVARDAQPETVAAAFIEHFSGRLFYVADLDAISGRAPDWASLQAMARAGASLILDVGLHSSAAARSLIEWNHSQTSIYSRAIISRLVIATESLHSLEELGARIDDCRGMETVLSIDLKEGEWFEPGTDRREKSSKFEGRSPEAVLDVAVTRGVTSVIVLDLAAVGTAGGPVTLDLCRRIRERHPAIELISGGGVRSLADVHEYVDSGCDAVLVASALHDGRIASPHHDSRLSN